MKITTILILLALSALITGFFWMIGLGIFSHIFRQPNLAISYWQSVVVGLVANFLIGLISKSK